MAFEDVPTVKLFSNKDLEEQMKVIKETIGNDKKDWKQRTESVRIKHSLFHKLKYFICYFNIVNMKEEIYYIACK
jgi:hypothetical protein